MGKFVPMHDMKAYRDMAVEVHSFLTSKINELSALLQGEYPQYPLSKRLVGPETALDASERTQNCDIVRNRARIRRTSSTWLNTYTV